jgi:hypothetical protein
MRFASSRASRPHLRELVAALDEDGVPAAATWRLVGETAAKTGLPRPSYPHLRRLVTAERRRRRAQRELRDAVREAASTFAAGRAPSFDHTLGRLLDAQADLADEEACVSETQASPGPRSRPV